MPEFHVQKGVRMGRLSPPWPVGGLVACCIRQGMTFRLFSGGIGGKEKSEAVEGWILGNLIEGSFQS